MSDTENSLPEDLAWLRSLAESGRAAPLQSGPYLVAGGAWFGGASALLALAQAGLVPLPASAVAWIWLLAAIGFSVTLVALLRRDRGRSEPGHNRLINATWSAAGFGIFVFWVATALYAMRIGDGAVMGTISLAVLTIYGLVWWIKGTLTGAVWMRTIALLSFASTLPVAITAGTPYSWLAYTLAIFCAVLGPGIYLMRVGGRAV